MFLVQLSHSGPRWDLSRPMEQQSHWLAHASYMDSLVAEGVIVLGGPLDEMRVVLVLDVESEEAARAALARDPWSGSHLRIDAVDRWTIRLDGRSAHRDA